MKPNFEKYADGLVPAVIQDAATAKVLMLGFMNAEAVEATVTTGKVTFFSRSKKRLWVKGETSGNFLELVSIAADCDLDTLLIKARPAGPICHSGSDTCFGEENNNEPLKFLSELEAVIQNRKSEPNPDSYVSKLFASGLNRIAQKVGEEAIETVIAAKDEDAEALLNEAADLLFHLLILINQKEKSLGDVVDILRERSNGSK